jgi:hypothetical protein
MVRTEGKALHPFEPKPGWGDFCGHVGDDGECGWPQADHQTGRHLIAMVDPHNADGSMKPQEQVADELWAAIQGWNMERAVEQALHCTCHNEPGSHELCCGHEDGRNPDCPIHGDGMKGGV